MTADHGVSQSFDVSFTVNATSPALTYTATLSQTGTYTFTGQTAGYSPVAAQSVTVTKTGTGDITNLAVALSGTNSSSFTLGALGATTLNSTTTSAAFTVKPQDGLAAGTYLATVTVTADHGVSQSFDVSFTVNATSPALTYTATLSQTGTYTFTGQTAGYSPVTAQSVTVTKTGTGDITNLAVALSGTNSSSFTLGALGATTLNSATTSAAFTVKPNDGLAVGTYAAIVTVTADPLLSPSVRSATITPAVATANGVSQSFNVSFTVHPAALTYTAVTYNGNGSSGGTVPTDSNNYTTGAAITVQGNTGVLVKSGYTYAGWNTAANGSGTSYAVAATFAMGSANVTLYAQWTANPTYTVTYNGNGSSGGTAPTDSNNYTTGAAITVQGNTGVLVKTGYTFAGWNTAANGSGTSYAVAATFAMGSANVTLYAQWTANPTYTVTYNGNGSSGGTAPTDSNNYTTGAAITVQGNTGVLVKTGYTFAGWNTAANGSGTSYAVAATFAMGSANVTLYAQWTANPSGGGSTPPTPTPPTITGGVVDGTTGTKVSNVTATVTTAANGTDTVTMSATQTVELKQPDGTVSPITDTSKVAITTSTGAVVPIAADGTIQVSSLAKGTDNNFSISYDLGNGQKIIMGTMNITVDNSGNVTLTTTLIDPYGIITDAATGKIISGVNVTLYYADTAPK